MKRASLLRGLVATSVCGAFAAVPALATSSCASIPDGTRYTAVIMPDFATYRDHVDVYMQKRCGTLDCHGQKGRGMVLYGRGGLRLCQEFDENLFCLVEAEPIPGETFVGRDAGPDSGLVDVPTAERRANYNSIAALEPEQMSRVMAKNGEGAEDLLLLLRKPLLKERHKGGTVMNENESGFKCVRAWLGTPPGGTLSPAAVADCAEAAALP